MEALNGKCNVTGMNGHPKTICMLIYGYFPVSSGGSENQCRLQSQALVSKGYRCIVLTARTNKSLPKYEIDDGCEIVRLAVAQPVIDALLRVKTRVSGNRSRRIIKGNSGMNNQIIDNQKNIYSRLVQWLNASFYIFGASIYLFRNRDIIDIIHTHIASWNAGYAGWIGNLLRIRVLCKASYLPAFHDYDGAVPFPETWRHWRKRIRYIALMPDMAVDIANNGVPPDRIDIIPNGVRIPPEVAAVDINRQVLYVGNFSQGAAHKGFDVLIKAWANVHKTLPDVRLIIAGGGESRPWQEMATALNCDESIQFSGHVSDMAFCYRQSALLSSHHGGRVSPMRYWRRKVMVFRLSYPISPETGKSLCMNRPGLLSRSTMQKPCRRLF